MIKKKSRIVILVTGLDLVSTSTAFVFGLVLA